MASALRRNAPNVPIKINKPPQQKSNKSIQATSDIKVFTCSRCGSQYIPQDAVRKFYKSKSSLIFTPFNESYTTLCTDCIDILYEELRIRYHDDKLGFICILHYLDIYYDPKVYDELIRGQTFSFSEYMRRMGFVAYKGKSFNNSLIDIISDLDHNSLFGNQPDEEESDIAWADNEITNKNYVIQNFGYDPFSDSSYTDEDRKFLFNTLSNYLDDAIIEDPHKMQRVASLVVNILQEEKANRLLSNEYRKPLPDPSIIKDITTIKRDTSQATNTIASEIGLSVKTSGKTSKGGNTLTNIMKEMIENNFDDAKVNLVDVKMSDTYRHIAEINAKALLNELNFQSDDYATMLSEQANYVQTLQDEKMKLEEENRLLKIELKNLNRSDSDG